MSNVSSGYIIGEVAASIAHEVNQPLAGMLTNANASPRWLDGNSLLALFIISSASPLRN